MRNEGVVQAPLWAGIGYHTPKLSRGSGIQQSTESGMQLLLGKNIIVQVSPRPEVAAPSRQIVIQQNYQRMAF